MRRSSTAPPDVVGWVYNHRSGVGYSIEYDWQGYQSRYFPDFIARAKTGEVFHNFIIEVKGRMDERDRAKARAWPPLLRAAHRVRQRAVALPSTHRERVGGARRHLVVGGAGRLLRSSTF